MEEILELKETRIRVSPGEGVKKMLRTVEQLWMDETWWRVTFPQKLKAKRLAMGFKTQKAFAEALCVPYKTYNGWERGDTVPSAYYVYRLVKFLLDN